MRRAAIIWFLAVLLGPGCGGNGSVLPDGAELGDFSDVDSPEYYPGSLLYSYMNGGAELYLQYGCLGLSVRRYARGSGQVVAELFEMHDRREAAALYTFLRRPGTEREIVPGSSGSVTPSEIQLSKGKYYLVCRSEDPMEQDGTMVLELCRRIAGRLPGESSVDFLFADLPLEARLGGSEIALSGPIALNQRPWLLSLGKDGFERGWMASYELTEGTVETVLAEYSRPETAEQASRELIVKPEAGLLCVAKDRRVALVRGEQVPADRLRDLAIRLLSASD
jgi:hypothetical protein